MNERALISLAFLGCLAGLFLLYIMSMGLTYDSKTIEAINSERISDMIKINGEVSSCRNSGNITFISLAQIQYIDVIVFDNITIPTGTNVEIIGQSEEYNSHMEIIASRIRRI